MQAIQLPPTPPDDRMLKNSATPPVLSRLLTPDSTPPGMRHALRHPSKHTPAPRADISERDTERHPSPAEHITITPDRDGRTPEVPGAFKEAEWEASSIPVTEPRSTLDQHNTILPLLEPQTHQPAHLAVSDFAVRQKPKKRARHARQKAQPRADPLTSLAQPSGDWNDLPSDMISNDQVYNQIQQHNMDRMEAKNPGAVEVVVLQPQQAQRHALRHMKKHRSLRADLRSSDSLRTKSRTAKAVQSPSKHTLKHRKAFEPAHQAVELPTGPVRDDDHPVKTRHALRHERRPLSAGRAELISINNTTDSGQTRHLALPLRPKHEPVKAKSHVLHHAAPQIHVEDEDRLRALEPQLLEQPDLQATAGLSPSIRSHRFTNTHTPLSALSDRTDMELCMAKNVSLFPHSNDSVFLIENSNAQPKKNLPLPTPLAPRTFRPLSFTFEDPESASTSSTESIERTFSTPEIRVNGNNTHTVDSPLTNPRAAPAPPAIKLLPPTPSSELDRQLSLNEKERPALQRNDSLLNKARRFSGSLITPLFPRPLQTYRYTNAARSPHVASLGNDRLHPMWVPTHMWDDEYSDSEDDFDPEDYGALPPGGDTSEHPAEPRGLFPRQMSVRMPGFRGNGGFLLGNSLGVERHGTNKRRHHVDLPSRGKRSSTARFTFFQTLRDRVRSKRAAREEAALEKRRTMLKDSIGVKIVHQSRL